MKSKIIPILAIISSIFVLDFTKSVQAGSNFTKDFDRLFLLLTIISVILTAIVLTSMAVFLYKYKGRSEEGAQNMSQINTRKLEVTWTLIATGIIVILMIVSYPVLVNSYDNNAQNIEDNYGKPTEIVVEGTQNWQWVFHTDNNVIKGEGFSDGYPRLNLTVGKPYKFVLWSSGDWIHSFFVRGLGFKEDVVPGVNNTISTVVTDPGTYLVVCNQYCGPGHSQMRAYLVVS